MNKVIPWFALTASAILSGCGGSSSSENTQDSSLETVSCSTSTSSTFNELRIYQVMAESFVNGDTSIGHGTGYGTSDHMGDIQGIIDSLDYIQSLGMNAIWVTPVFYSIPMDSQDQWADRLDATGYFASDYFTIDPRFGTLEKARELVETAHAKGLYVFFDGVFGHHKDNIVQSPNGNLPSGDSNPVSYPESIDFYKEVATYWINELKIDGWRLDQAYQVPQDSWIELRKSVQEASQSVTYIDSNGDTVNPLGYMVAEIWNGEDYIAETGYGSEGTPVLCSAFDFPVRYRIVETFAVNESGVTSSTGGEWLQNGMETHNTYATHAVPNLMIGNHDLVRFGDLLQRGNIAEPTQDEYWERHKAAFSFQAAYSGPITLYYGEEIGDEVDGFSDQVTTDCAIQGLCDDHVARNQGIIEGVTGDVLDSDQNDLKDYITSLMSLRDQHSSLYNGSRTNLISDSSAFADLKTDGDESILFMVSTQSATHNHVLNNSQLNSVTQLRDLITNEVFSVDSGSDFNIQLTGFQARFLLLE